MGSIARAVLRERLVSVILVALAVALFFGGSLAALAGARRSSTAIGRFLAHSAPEDVFVASADGSTFDVAAVTGLPEVLGAAYEAYLAMVPVGPDGRPQTDRAGSINPYVYAPVSGALDTIDALRIVRGRGLDPTQPLEVVIDEELAADRGLSVGSHLPMATFSAEQAETVFGGETGAETPEPEGPTLDLRVVGIARMPVDLHPDEEEHTTSFGGTKDIYLTPALLDRYGDDVTVFGGPGPGSPIGVRLVHGLDDLDTFSSGAHQLPGVDDLVIDVSDSDALGSAIIARNAVSVETAALTALGVLLAVSGVALVGHALARLARSVTSELEILRAMGARPNELLTLTATPGLAAMAGGTVGAIAVSLAVSALTPIGLAREAEVSPGVRVDGAVLLAGIAVLAVLGATLAILTARPTARSVGAVRRQPTPATRGLAAGLSSGGAPFGPTIGARFATARRGSERSAPLRSAITAGALALAGLVAVATFVASLQRLSSTPEAQGAQWDLSIGNINLSDYGPDDYARLDAAPHITGVAAVAAPQGLGSVDGRDTSLVGLDVVSGGVAPRLLSGRLPRAPGEVVLGHRTARQLGKAVGDRVTVTYAGADVGAKVVGTALLGPGIAPSMQIGQGAVVTIEQMRALSPDQPTTFLLARVQPGASVDESIAGLQRDWGKDVARPVQAADVVNLRRVRRIPVALAGALAAAAASLVGAALVLSVRQRRADIGVLRALGATRRQLASALCWQAAWIYGAAALVGLPLGVILGRVLWRQVSEGLGALVAPVVPADQVALIALGGFVVVGAMVLLPARATARQSASAALRAE